MMKNAAILSLASAAAGSKITDLKAQSDFSNFVKKFNKQYTMEEVATRFATFKANMATIEAHDASQGWTMAMNEFADLTWEEFSAQYKGYNHRQRDYARSQNAHVAPEGQTIADSVDWTTKGAVTPVKDQGQCGSCWAFSTTGGMEGAVQLATGSLTSLSEQQLVDCAGSSGNQGCNGGLMDDGFEWIIQHGGLGAEDSYPYTAKDGSCKRLVKSVSQISSYKDVTGGEEGLLSAVSQQPVSIAIEADQRGFQFYSGGVFSGRCGNNLDHGVLLVGYGSEDGTDYWKVKNSWGASWGDSGYIRIERGKDLCGIADAASYPVA